MRGLLIAAVVLVSFGVLNAGNIDILGIRSAEYLMELSRNAVTDCADGATYNPAGLAFMEDGFHLNFGGQYIGKNYTITGTFLGTTEETELTTTKPTPFIPNFYAVYKTGSLAAFGGFNVPAGGGPLSTRRALLHACPSDRSWSRQSTVPVICHAEPGQHGGFIGLHEGFGRCSLCLQRKIQRRPRREIYLGEPQLQGQRNIQRHRHVHGTASGHRFRGNRR